MGSASWRGGIFVWSPPPEMPLGKLFTATWRLEYLIKQEKEKKKKRRDNLKSLIINYKIWSLESIRHQLQLQLLHHRQHNSVINFSSLSHGCVLVFSLCFYISCSNNSRLCNDYSSHPLHSLSLLPDFVVESSGTCTENEMRICIINFVGFDMYPYIFQAVLGLQPLKLQTWSGALLHPNLSISRLFMVSYFMIWHCHTNQTRLWWLGAGVRNPRLGLIVSANFVC